LRIITKDLNLKNERRRKSGERVLSVFIKLIEFSSTDFLQRDERKVQKKCRKINNEERSFFFFFFGEEKILFIEANKDGSLNLKGERKFETHFNARFPRILFLPRSLDFLVSCRVAVVTQTC
jgi:hypothetical protein